MARRKPDPELWDTAQVAAHLGYTGGNAEAAARVQMRRWGIEAVDRQPNRDGGKNRYPAHLIQARRPRKDPT